MREGELQSTPNAVGVCLSRLQSVQKAYFRKERSKGIDEDSDMTGVQNANKFACWKKNVSFGSLQDFRFSRL